MSRQRPSIAIPELIRAKDRNSNPCNSTGSVRISVFRLYGKPVIRCILDAIILSNVSASPGLIGCIDSKVWRQDMRFCYKNFWNSVIGARTVNLGNLKFSIILLASSNRHCGLSTLHQRNSSSPHLSGTLWWEMVYGCTPSCIVTDNIDTASGVESGQHRTYATILAH